MGEIRVLTQQGDIIVSWNPGDEQSTAQAREEFDRLKADGYEFFKSGAKRRTRVKAFKDDAGEILAVPGVQTTQDKTKRTRQKAMAGGPNERVAARL